MRLSVNRLGITSV